jgi:hypothetical protein
VLEKIRILSPLIPIIFFGIFCRKRTSKELWVFFVYCLASLLVDLFLATSLWASEHRFSIWNFFDVFEIIILSYFYYLIIHQRVIRIIIIFLAIFYTIFYFFYSKSDNDQYHSTIGVVGSIIILIFTLFYIMNVMKPTLEPINIFTPAFLISIAFLISDSSTLFLNIIANKFTVSEIGKYWNISNYANILMNIIFSYAFVLFYIQQKSKPPESHSVDFTSPNDR